MTRTALLAIAFLLPAPALAQGFPAVAPRGIDGDVRRILATDGEPVGFLARCIVSEARSTYMSTTQEERRRSETRIATLLALVPQAAKATGITRERAMAVIGLATMPLATFSIGLVPARAPGAEGPDPACRSAANAPDAYLDSLPRP